MATDPSPIKSSPTSSDGIAASQGGPEDDREFMLMRLADRQPGMSNADFAAFRANIGQPDPVDHLLHIYPDASGTTQS